MNLPFRLIDLFAGCGGFTLGLTHLRTTSGDPIFEPVWANDMVEDAVATYNENFGDDTDHCTVGDIFDLLGADFTVPKADIVIGGPPCQGYSLLNKNREADPRKQLWRPYMEVVERSGAKVFVVENVPQLLGSGEYKDIKNTAEDLGFEVRPGELLAADYGVPQTRKRAFVIGSRVSDPSRFFPPNRTHCDPDEYQRSLFEEKDKDLKTWNTVRDAIYNLPRPVGTEIRDEPLPFDLHFSRSPTAKSINRYIAVQEEGANRYDLQERAPEITPACWKRKTSGGTDIFGRLWWDRPAFTIRTEFFKPEKGRSLHPEQHRAITHREAARFQSFPDSFTFKGNKTSIARQIGNAVPPLLGAHVGRCAALCLKEDLDATIREEEFVPKNKYTYNTQPLFRISENGSRPHTSANGTSKHNSPNGSMSESEIERLCKQLRDRIKDLGKEPDEDKLRSNVQRLADTGEVIDEIGKELFPEANSGKERILKYFRKFPRTPISGAELSIVAGIKEWARRVRELRVESGWPIYTGHTLREMMYEGDLFEPEVPPGAKDMAGDDYMLLKDERDEEEARRWETANEIRNSGGSIKDRLLRFFRENVDEVVTGEELKYVSGDAQSWPRRVRELRTEEGWHVRTQHTGRPDLDRGEYILEDEQRDEPHDRNIPDKVRSTVLDRDYHRCRKCDMGYEDFRKRPSDPRHRLELHHARPHVEGGENNADNLVTLCNVCHDEVHRQDRLSEPDELETWLSSEDQP